MTLAEIKEKHPNTRLVAMASPSNGLALYAGTHRLDWPEDWPEKISGAFLEDCGFEVLS